MLSTTTSTVEVRDQDPLVAIPSTIKLPDGKVGDKVAHEYRNGKQRRVWRDCERVELNALNDRDGESPKATWRNSKWRADTQQVGNNPSASTPKQYV